MNQIIPVVQLTRHVIPDSMRQTIRHWQYKCQYGVWEVQCSMFEIIYLLHQLSVWILLMLTNGS